MQSKDTLKALVDEIKCYRRITHKNVVTLHEIYESAHSIHMVQELLKGGELHD